MTDDSAVRALLEEDLAELYEESPAGYVSTLLDGTVVRSNRTFSAWTGLAPDALRGRRFQDLLATPGRIYYETHLGPLLAMQGSLNEIALDIAAQDGRMLPVLVSATQKRGRTGEALLNRFTVFNATDRRRYEQQLLQARRAAEAQAAEKTELLAMLSHDIRTPLSAIMVVAEILQLGHLSPEQRDAVRILNASSKSLLDLVNGILDKSRLEAGAPALHVAPFDPRALVRDLVTSLEPLAGSKSLRLRVALDERLPPQVAGDALKLGQVLGNLLGNALKFTERGEIALELAVLDANDNGLTVRARVVDSGIGMSEDAVSRIFRDDTAIAPRPGGSGLGLAISRKLLRAQGSELQVRSRAGEGSEFWFDLRVGTVPTA